MTQRDELKQKRQQLEKAVLLEKLKKNPNFEAIRMLQQNLEMTIDYINNLD